MPALERILAYSRKPDGTLSFVESESGGIGAAGLSSTHTRAVVSPDSAHVYVTNRDEDSLLVYERDLVTGALVFLDAEIEGVDGVSGIASGKSVMVSPGGEHVYVASAGRVAAFSRDASTGLLTFIEAEAGAIGQEATLAPDGLHLYLLAGTKIYVFHRDGPTGALTFDPGLTLDFSNFGGGDLAISPDGLHLYAGMGSRLYTLARNAATGSVALIDWEFADGHDIEISSDGSHVYRGNKLWDRNPVTGTLTYNQDFYAVGEFLTLAPGGAQLYSAGAWGIASHDRDLVDGGLSFTGGFHPFDLVSAATISADGEHVYLIEEFRSLLGVFGRDAATGDLTFQEMHANDFLGVNGFGEPTDVVLSPDDAHLYVAGRADAAVAVFARDAATGLLTFVESERDGVGGVTGLEFIGGVTVSPDGAHVYATGHDHVVLFDRDAATGSLSFVSATYLGSAIGRDVVATANGLHVIVAATSAVYSFARDAATGELTLADEFPSPGNESLVATSDSAFVYAFDPQSFDDDELEALALDPATGRLDRVETEVSFQNGAFGLDDIRSFALGADESHLFVFGDGLTVYRRDAPSGRLALVETEPIETGSNSSIGAVLASPDGAHIYLLGSLLGFVGIGDIVIPDVSCPPVPAVGCTGAPLATATFTEHIVDARDRVSWAWKKGGEILPAEIDPGTDNHFLLCGYDESGPPSLVYGALVPAGEDCRTSESAVEKPCWTATATSSKLKDRFQTPDGVKKVVIKSGASGTTKVTVKASGFHVEPPTLPLGLPFHLQLQTVAGPCWESLFTTATKNDTSRFKAKTK